LELAHSTCIDVSPSVTGAVSEYLRNEYHILTHTHTFNGPLSGTTRVSRYQKGNTNLDFTEATDSEWQWHRDAVSGGPSETCLRWWCTSALPAECD